jgi:hypothetical protein
LLLSSQIHFFTNFRFGQQQAALQLCNHLPDFWQGSCRSFPQFHHVFLAYRLVALRAA